MINVSRVHDLFDQFLIDRVFVVIGDRSISKLNQYYAKSYRIACSSFHDVSVVVSFVVCIDQEFFVVHLESSYERYVNCTISNIGSSFVDQCLTVRKQRKQLRRFVCTVYDDQQPQELVDFPDPVIEKIFQRVCDCIEFEDK